MPIKFSIILLLAVLTKMYSFKLNQIYLIVFSINFVNSARILGIFYIPCVSHQTAIQPVFKELSLRGHEVVVATPNPLRDPSLTNLTEIDLSFLYQLRIPESSYVTDYSGFLGNIYENFIFPIVEEVLKVDKVQNLCENEHFDLVIVESLVPIFYAVGHKCKAPTIGIITLEGFLNSHWSQGNPTHPSLYADYIMPIDEQPSLWQKIKNSYNFIWYKMFYKYSILSRSDELKKTIKNDLPLIEELENNSSMLFVNTNWIVHKIRPLTPTTQQLGFLHIRPPKPLPRDIQTVLDQAAHGAIYFSLGSNVRSAELSNDTLKAIKEALSEVPYTVLWKWESDDIPDVGKNVITKKWFPQQDVLAHKNVKSFITQGGLQSTEEAIHYGVPMVGIPFLGDQAMNIKLCSQKGITIFLDRNSITKDNLKRTITEIMENPKYYEQIQKLRAIVQDQPMTGLERAVWWSEYVIRHKGTKHLKSNAVNMPVWEYLLLDVICVVLLGFLIASVACYRLARVICNMFFSASQKQKIT